MVAIEDSYRSHPRYALDLDAYLILSTTLSVFLWQILYAGTINVFLGYFLVLANTAWLFLRGELVIHRFHAYFLTGMALISMLAATITHNPVRAEIAQIFGISIFSIYHYSVLHRTRFSLTRVMEIYIHWANAIAILGYPLWLFHKAKGETFYRFNSWFAEPSHYVYATLPAASYILLKSHRDKKMNYAALPLLFSYVLADSSTGYLGIALTILLMADFRSLKRILAAAAVIVLASYLTYTLSGNVQLRVNDTLSAMVLAETSDAVRAAGPNNSGLGANPTTFAMLSNGYVAWQAFRSSPLLGNGLGTHTTSYEKYAGDVVNPAFIFWGLNRDDANSLALRLMSETGLVGMAGTIFLLIYFGRTKGRGYTLIRDAIIPYFIMRLIRYGAYFSMENFFFIMIYGMNFLESRRAAQHVGAQRQPMAGHHTQEKPQA